MTKPTNTVIRIDAVSAFESLCEELSLEKVIGLDAEVLVKLYHHFNNPTVLDGQRDRSDILKQINYTQEA
jgi:hypothetical protein